MNKSLACAGPALKAICKTSFDPNIWCFWIGCYSDGYIWNSPAPTSTESLFNLRLISDCSANDAFFELWMASIRFKDLACSNFSKISM